MISGSLSNTQKKLLEAGKREFMDKGYESASLRKIVREAGFTLGAFYGYYPNKAALFTALVEEPAQTLLKMYVDLQENFSKLPADEQEQSMVEYSGEGMDDMFHYIYRYFDEFYLIVCCASGTQYEHYIDRMTEIEIASTEQFITYMRGAGKAVHEVDSQLIHILCSAMFSGLFEIVVHRMPQSKAVTYISSLREFYAAGWMKLLGI
ncbi:MAG: TetR/AcrR family transcriptional regulator [Lachnospiraceae bacterium]